MYEIIENCVFSLFTCLKWNNYVVQTSHEFVAILHAHQNCIFVIFFVTILQISKLFFQLNVISDLGFWLRFNSWEAD